MTTQEAAAILLNKSFEVDDRYYHFREDGVLLIAGEDESVYGTYEFYLEKGSCFLRMDPDDFKGDMEITIVLNSKTGKVPCIEIE